MYGRCRIPKANFRAVDAVTSFPNAKGKVRQFEFQSGESGIVVLRGLQFYAGDEELIPTLIPVVPWT